MSENRQRYSNQAPRTGTTRPGVNRPVQTARPATTARPASARPVQPVRPTQNVRTAQTTRTVTNRQAPRGTTVQSRPAANRRPTEDYRQRALRERRRQERIIIIAGIILILVVAAILFAIFGGKEKPPAFVEPTVAPTVEATAVPTAAPTQEPTPEPTPDDIADPVRAANRPEAVANLLPVFKRANTEEKIIAITVDDCFQVENLRGIIELAIQNDAKLTIFPLGKVAVRSDMIPLLQYAWQNGMELENHTYSHSALYDVSEEELAQQIYNQNLALSNALGVEYQCHFLRPRGGDARNDERIHAYIRQLGYKGVAHWSTSGSGGTQEKLIKTLAPGNIYLFHTTDVKDYEKLQWFIPYAVSQGYRLVTLNEMFGYPQNETRPLTKPIDQYVAPTLAPYQSEYLVMKAPVYDNRVFRLQQALMDLGYLELEPDGVYGSGSAELIKLFQEDQGLQVTGIADVETQIRLYELADKAAKGPHPTVRPR